MHEELLAQQETPLVPADRKGFFLPLLFSSIVFVCKDAKLQSCIKLFLNWPIKMAVAVLSYIYFFETMSASSRALPF